MQPGPATRFVTGRAVSDCGDWLTTVAVAVGLYTLTRSLAAPALAILFRVGTAWVDVGLTGLIGLASAPYEILAASELARTVAPDRLGQVSGAVWLFGYAGMLGGGLLAAIAAPRLGWMPTLLVAWLAGTALLATGWARPRGAAVTLTGSAAGAASLIESGPAPQRRATPERWKTSSA